MLFCVGKDGQFVLAMSNLFGNTSFYGYDGWRFYETKVQPKDDIFRNADGLYFHMQHEIPMFIVKNSRPNITLTTKNYYTAKFMKTFPKYELLESTLKTVQELNRTVYDELIPDAKVFNESYQAVKDEIVYVDQDVNITGEWKCRISKYLCFLAIVLFSEDESYYFNLQFLSTSKIIEECFICIP